MIAKRLTLSRHAKSLPKVTTLAIFESQITAEGPFTVVATSAVHASTRGKMLRHHRRADLLTLRRGRSQVVTTRALQPLTRAMLGVIEIGAKRTRVGRRSGVSLFFVADTARRNFTPAGRRA